MNGIHRYFMIQQDDLGLVCQDCQSYTSRLRSLANFLR